jgi:hypothetical protein
LGLDPLADDDGIADRHSTEELSSALCAKWAMVDAYLLEHVAGEGMNVGRLEAGA